MDSGDCYIVSVGPIIFSSFVFQTIDVESSLNINLENVLAE